MTAPGGAPRPGPPPALECEWKAYLCARGLAVPDGVLVPSAADAAAIRALVDDLRPPLAVKAQSAAIVHKSDVGAVRLGVGDAAAAALAVADMRAALGTRGLGDVAGFLVEEMAEPGVELTLGTVVDACFGRLVAFGAGGTRVEALGEVRFFAAPLRRRDVETLVASVPWLPRTLARLGVTARHALEAALWRFGGPDGLAAEAGLDHVEINPLIVNARGAVAVDVRGAFRAC